MRRRKLVALVAIALLAISAVSYAQRRRGFGGGRGGGYRGGYYQVRRPDADLLTGDFTFCRLAYRQATDGDGGGWGSTIRARIRISPFAYPSSVKRASTSTRATIPTTT